MEKTLQHCLYFPSLPRTKDLRPGETESSSNASSVKVRSNHQNSALKANGCSPLAPSPHLCMAKDSLGFLGDTQC